MYGKIATNIFLIILLSVAQLSFVSSMPLFFNQANLLIVTLIFILTAFNFKVAILWAFGAGLVFDFFSFSVFGTILLSFVIMIYFAHLLLDNFFTNRSLYTFIALVSIATFFYGLLFYFFNYLGLELIGNGQSATVIKKIIENMVYQILVNDFITAIVFYGVNFISQKLKPFFLVKTNRV
jgi:rod shape-determining protein MreD